MRIFPAIDELPSMLQTRGWQWEQFSCSPYPKHGFWLATDERGHQWLAKMRGSFYGYRELVFARIAQRLGWSCQSSFVVFGRAFLWDMCVRLPACIS